MGAGAPAEDRFGEVPLHPPHPGRRVDNVTVVREANGWHVVFSCSFEHDVPANDNPSVGVDRGIVNNVALSTGELFAMPDGTALMERHKAWQRTASRRSDPLCPTMDDLEPPAREIPWAHPGENSLVTDEDRIARDGRPLVYVMLPNGFMTR